MRVLTTLFLMVIFSGCSSFTFNAQICDRLATHQNPLFPDECKRYNEEEASRTFDKDKPTNEDDIKFNSSDKVKK